MKKVKKLPQKQLEKFSSIFTQLGLVLVLFVVFVTLEHKTEKKGATAFTTTSNDTDEPTFVITDFRKELKRVVVETPKPQKPVLKPVQVLTKVEPIKNTDIVKQETVVQIPVDQPTEINKTNVVIPSVPKTPENTTVSIRSVQKAPVFKGCEGLSEAENRICFEKKMKQLVQRHFDTDLANELGLRSGKNKILTQFVIDKNGLVTDIKVRAPHPRLKDEANRIIKKIPKFKPGEQNDKAVQVRYTLPISFMVE
ncbi:energy transducer TonB [Tenacibaculum amylolyticum]|uniref:energy transducer TonB n=1 Tax=Tenacibaculum amylolyticum TaxID=104269 RepID=UPI0038955650